VDEGDAENTLEGVQDGHLAAGAGLSGDLDLVGGDGGVGSSLFSVRLFRKNMVSFRFLIAVLGWRGRFGRPLMGVRLDIRTILMLC
jgi:hypothetical protein